MYRITGSNPLKTYIDNNLNTNTLVLVDRIAHGEHLLDFFKTRTSMRIRSLEVGDVL